MNKVCKVDDCNETVSAKERCRKHYLRFQRHGDDNIVLKSYVTSKRYIEIQKQVPLWLKDYDEGLLASEIARKYNRNQVTVAKYLKENGRVIDPKVSKLGKRNPQWRGKAVGYGALHDYIKSHKNKPNACDDCGENKILDLANISQQYKRDVSDWEWLCRSCHMKKDGRLKALVTCEKCGHARGEPL